MSTIQFVEKERRELIEDLQEIIRKYQPLKGTAPQEYRRAVVREMRDYLQQVKCHPVFSEFCELTHIDQDEFMNDILHYNFRVPYPLITIFREFSVFLDSFHCNRRLG